MLMKFRKKTAIWLVGLAKRLYPESPETEEFLQKLVFDYSVKGQAFVIIDPEKVYLNG